MLKKDEIHRPHAIPDVPNPVENFFLKITAHKTTRKTEHNRQEPQPENYSLTSDNWPLIFQEPSKQKKSICMKPFINQILPHFRSFDDGYLKIHVNNFTFLKNLLTLFTYKTATMRLFRMIKNIRGSENMLTCDKIFVVHNHISDRFSFIRILLLKLWQSLNRKMRLLNAFEKANVVGIINVF